MRGFTLIEILVSFAILSLLFIGVYAVFNVGSITYYMDMGLLDLQQQARQAMDLMTKEVREAEANQISITHVDSDDDQVTFSTPTKTDIKYYRDLTENRIMREYPAGTTKILANDINSLEFLLTGSVLRIQLQAGKMVRQKQLSFSLTEKVRSRNE